MTQPNTTQFSSQLSEVRFDASYTVEPATSKTASANRRRSTKSFAARSLARAFILVMRCVVLELEQSVNNKLLIIIVYETVMAALSSMLPRAMLSHIWLSSLIWNTLFVFRQEDEVVLTMLIVMVLHLTLATRRARSRIDFCSNAKSKWLCEFKETGIKPQHCLPLSRGKIFKQWIANTFATTQCVREVALFEGARTAGIDELEHQSHIARPQIYCVSNATLSIVAKSADSFVIHTFCACNRVSNTSCTFRCRCRWWRQ